MSPASLGAPLLLSALQPNGLRGSSHLIWLPPLAQWLVPDIGYMICMIQTGPSQLYPRTFQRGATEIHTYFLLFGCGSLRMCAQSRQCLPWRDREATWGCWCLRIQSFLRSASTCLSYSSALWVNRFIHFLRHKWGFLSWEKRVPTEDTSEIFFCLYFYLKGSML